MKKCSRCKIEKLHEKFSFKSKEKGILQPYCKECQAEYQKIRYINDKQYYVDKARERKKILGAWWTEFKKTLKCAKCPENHPATLDFHHIDGKTKDHNLSSMAHSGFGFDRIREEINKCIILCANCHRKLHWDERQEVS